MARIFLSHSSIDDMAALAVHDWLACEGWDDVFLDLDPAGGIAAGERWERRLYEAANRCEAVVFLISRSWLASEWCLREYDLAARLNKRIFGVLIEPLGVNDLPPRLSQTWQLVDLAQGQDHQTIRSVLPSGAEGHVTFSKAGLLRLKTGLAKAGLDPRFFDWPPAHDLTRPPYRGMLPLEAGDAGIFFGRDAQIIGALDELRGLAAAAEPRFRAILGASGAGKSSFLRAGLLPRLARDDRHFLPLPVIRPERKILSGETGLVRSLEKAFAAQGMARTRAEIRVAVGAGAKDVLPLLAALAKTARAPQLQENGVPEPPALVLSIDQGEEMFTTAGRDEAEIFLPLLSDLLLASSPRIIGLVTIRSDSFEALQMAPELVDVQPEPISLPPLPRGAYQSVIEGPAQRLKDTDRALIIEPQLTEALLSDIEAGGAKDALPLLAFTLERLYSEYGAKGKLAVADYRALGGIRGSIEAAVDRALARADGDPSVPQDRQARLLLLRRALIPWLAGIDRDTLSPRRQVSRMKDIPLETRPLVEHLIAERLLATDIDHEGDRTVEPAHEALLRQWGVLEGWLKEDEAALLSLDGLQRATRDWAANAKDPAYLVHWAGRLEDAEGLLARPDLADKLDNTDREYLKTARNTETERRDRELEEAHKLALAERGRLSLRKALIGVSFLSVIVAAGLTYNGWLYFEHANALSEKAISLLSRAEQTESRARDLEIEARHAQLRGAINEFAASRTLLSSNPESTDLLAEVVYSGNALGYELLNNERHEEAAIVFSQVNEHLEDKKSNTFSSFERVAATIGLTVANSKFEIHSCRRQGLKLSNMTIALNSLVFSGRDKNHRGEYQRWFRGTYYAVNRLLELGCYDLALTAISAAVAEFRDVNVDAKTAEIKARLFGLQSWSALLAGQPEVGLSAVEAMETLIERESLTGFGPIMLNKAHLFLIDGRVQEALRLYALFSRLDIESDFTVMEDAGLCSMLNLEAMIEEGLVQNEVCSTSSPQLERMGG